jgi:hypothetical protein
MSMSSVKRESLRLNVIRMKLREGNPREIMNPIRPSRFVVAHPFFDAVFIDEIESRHSPNGKTQRYKSPTR